MFINKEFKIGLFSLYFIAFFLGFATMVLELVSGRILAPFFGTSLIVWTSVIGFVLTAMVLGYFFGGKYAERFSTTVLPGSFLLISGVFTIAIPALLRFLGSEILNNGSILDTGLSLKLVWIFIVCLLVCSFPVVLLSAVQPMVVKRLHDILQNVGKSSGNVSALTSFGSILGTFLSGFVFIPFLGSRLTLWLCGIFLVILGIILTKFKSKLVFALLVFFVFSSGLKIGVPIKQTNGLLEEKDSSYSYIQVYKDERNIRYMSFNEGSGVQSVYNPNSLFTGVYYDYFSVLPFFLDKQNKTRVLVVGLAGGVIPKQLKLLFGEKVSVDAVEIDSEVVSLASKYFDLNTKEVNVFTSDARIFLSKQGTPKYDLVVVDAYSQEFYIPWTLATKEFWQIVKEKLDSNGLVAANVNSFSENSELLKTLVNTQSSVFPFVYQAKLPPLFSLNYMLVAGNSDLNLTNNFAEGGSESAKKLLRHLQGRLTKTSFDPSASVFTDNKAPVEYLTDKMAWQYFTAK